MIEKIQAVVFDFDGVLVESEHVNIAAAKRTFSALGTPLSETEVRTIPGISSSRYIPTLLMSRGINDQKEIERIIKMNRSNYDTLWDQEVRITPNARGVVHILHANELRLAIATSNRRSVVEKFINAFDMNERFDFAVTGEDVARHKPDPEVYLIARDRLDVDPQRILAVEDTEPGVASAKAAGLACAALRNKFSRHHNLSRADIEITSLIDLIAL